MKLKLKVSKQLKRALKQKATAMEMERTPYLLKVLHEHLKKCNMDSSKVPEYKTFLDKRVVELEALKTQLEEDEVPTEEKRTQLKKFYETHHMYRHVQSKNRQLENIILTLEDDDYYCLMMLADQDKQTVENYVEKILHFFK